MTNQQMSTHAIVEPPAKTSSFFLKMFLLGICSTIGFTAIALLEIRPLLQGPDRTDIIIVTIITIGFFVLVDLLVLYYYLSYICYFASSIEIDSHGIRRVKNGIVKEQYAWTDVAGFYINAEHTPTDNDWILITDTFLNAPTKRLFHIRGYFGVKLSKHIIFQLSYTSEKASLLKQFAEERPV